MTNQTENFYQVLSSVFGGFSQKRHDRSQRQAVISSRSLAEAGDVPVDRVTWSAGLFQAISDDLVSVWKLAA